MTARPSGTRPDRRAGSGSCTRHGSGCGQPPAPPDGFEVSGDDDEPPRYAFLGVRPCDLRAIAIQDRVLAQPGSRYGQRRARVFIVAVNCTEPGETCFCASMGTGPGVDGVTGYDLALTELR